MPSTSVEEVTAKLLTVVLRKFPWRFDTDPYRVLLSEMLLQRTTGSHAAKVYATVIAEYPNVAALASADERLLATGLAPLGLNKRASWIVRAAQHIVKHRDGAVPRAADDLLWIPFVGPYTAAAVRCFAFGEPEATIDVNVARVVIRLFGLQPTGMRLHTLREVHTVANRVLAERPQAAVHLNYAMIDVGGVRCRRRPRCNGCELRQLCAVGSARLSDPLG